MKILIEGWFSLPHSYAIVLGFQIKYFLKLKKDIQIYIKEEPYYSPNWKKIEVDYHGDFMRKTKVHSGEQVDIIYRITYPYNITIDKENIGIPKCIFYTSEFSILDASYFRSNDKSDAKEMSYIKKLFKTYKNLYVTSPSIWSSNGMKDICPDNRNRTISHGVDPEIFYIDPEGRKYIRKHFGINDTDIVLMNIGAMTGSKGIIFLLKMINVIVHKLNRTNYKLFLKGLNDLYNSDALLTNLFDALRDDITIEERDKLFKNNNIIVVSNTISFDDLRHLYNACDIYVTPYFAEGFNMPPLEALACGTHVCAPMTGSTTEYINDIYGNSTECIHFIKSSVGVFEDGRKYNDIIFDDILETVIKLESFEKDEKTSNYVRAKYSWINIAQQMYDYFEYIINGT